MSKYSVEAVTNVSFDLAEGPHWDQNNQLLYFVDIFDGDIYQLNPKSGDLRKHHIGGNVSVIIPYNNSSNDFIISQDKKILKLNFGTKQLEHLAEIETNLAGNRFNDGKCDARGRLWIGTMGKETSLGVVERDSGSLYSYDGSVINANVSDIGLSNGIAWSLDNTLMYFIDSTKRLIYVFQYNLDSGNLSNQKIFVDLNNNTDFGEKELPDGMTIDKNGNLWVACFNGGRIVKIDKNSGRVLDQIIVNALRVTSLCFGGNQLNELYVTTAKKCLTEQEKSQQPNAGKILRITSDDIDFGGADYPYSFSIQ